MLALCIFLLGSETVSLQIKVEGLAGAGVTVAAKGEAIFVEARTDRAGIAVLELPPDTPMSLHIEGYPVGDVRTPPPGYNAQATLEWPPEFVVRVVEATPDVAAGPSGKPIVTRAFLIEPLDPKSPSRDVQTDDTGRIRIDWMLPGERFMLIYKPPLSSEEDWVRLAEPLEVYPNAEELIRFQPRRRIRLRNIEFATGESSFRPETEPETRRVLDEFADRLKRYFAEHPEIAVQVEGHTDNRGTPDTNLALSERRAKTVRAYLVSRGVDPSRVVAVGYGETSPLSTNNTDEGRATNRRVEVHFVTAR